jgi:hypothetical protein
MDVYLHGFLTSALDGKQCLGKRPDRFIPGVSALGTHFIRGWVGFSLSRRGGEEKKISLPVPVIEPRSFSP